MRAEYARRRRDEGSSTSEPLVLPRRTSAAAVLALQTSAGNAATTRMLARLLSNSDKQAMSRWGKKAAAQKAALEAMGPEEAYKAIAKFCEDRKGKGDEPPTVDDVMLELGLKTSQVKKPKEDTNVEGFTFQMDLLTRGRVQVGFDDHQNKHQVTKLHGISDNSGGSGQRTQYPDGRDKDWHVRTTAPIAVRWANSLKARLDPPGTKIQSATGEELFNAGHKFVATAMKASDGTIYVSYHCYPA